MTNIKNKAEEDKRSHIKNKKSTITKPLSRGMDEKVCRSQLENRATMSSTYIHSKVDKNSRAKELQRDITNRLIKTKTSSTMN